MGSTRGPQKGSVQLVQVGESSQDLLTGSQIYKDLKEDRLGSEGS